MGSLTHTVVHADKHTHPRRTHGCHSLGTHEFRDLRDTNLGTWSHTTHTGVCHSPDSLTDKHTQRDSRAHTLPTIISRRAPQIHMHPAPAGHPGFLLPLPLAAWRTWHQQEHRHWRAAWAVGVEGSESIPGHLLASRHLLFRRGDYALSVWHCEPGCGQVLWAGLSPILQPQAHQCSLGWGRKSWAHPVTHSLSLGLQGQGAGVCREAFCCWCSRAQAWGNSPRRHSFSSFPPLFLLPLSPHPSISLVLAWRPIPTPHDHPTSLTLAF